MTNTPDEYSFRKTTRLQRVVRSFFRAIGPVLVFGLLGFLILYLDTSGAFLRWESLGKPPGEVNTILSASCFFVFVETKTGEIYGQGKWNPEWEISSQDEIPEERKDFEWGYRHAPAHRDTIQLEDASASIYETLCYTAIALRKDGNIYRWTHERHALILLFKSITYPVIGLALGARIMTVLDQSKADRKRIKKNE